jgi:hypothetical protein
MDDAYYRSLPGSPEHRAAYMEEFEATAGVGAAVPDDPELSYYVDNAWELEYDRYIEALEADHDAQLDASPPEPEPESDPQLEISDPEIEMEPW